jgi:hypothetical protein
MPAPLDPVFRFAAFLACLILAPALAQAGDWPPQDPADAAAKVEFTPAFAEKLRGIRNFRQLQDAAGAKGHITDVVLEGDSPHVVYSWTGAKNRSAKNRSAKNRSAKNRSAKNRSAKNRSRMRALFYENGDFGAVITPAGKAGDIVLNNFAAFVCPSCSPPVNSCGHRPSWVPHDLHWDVFDCGCTLTGPQSLSSGTC